MKRLDRYMLKELFWPFLIGTVALVLMFQANMLIAILKEFNSANIPNLAIAQLIWYKTPEFLKLVLPAGMALSTSLAMSRLVRESELTAMRTAGAPILRVILPVALFGVVVGGANFYLIETIQPEAEKLHKEVASRALILGAMPDFKSNVMLRVGPRGTIFFGTVERLPDGRGRVTDLVYIESQSNNVMVVVTAPEGFVDRGRWELNRGIFRRFRDDILEDMKANTIRLDERITLEDVFTGYQPRELGIEELQEMIGREKSVGRDVRMLEVEYYVRYALPAACLVFAFTGPVMAVWFGRSGGYVGIFLAILLAMAYYNVYVVSTEIFGRNGWFPPLLAAWFPNLFFIGFGLIALRRLE